MRFSENHEWVTRDGDEYTVGISIYAAEQLGDIVFVDLPDDDSEFDAGDEAAVIESVKAAAEVYSPVGGTVIATNPAIEENSGLVNEDPEGEGWLFRIRSDNPGDYEALTSEEDYRDSIQ